MERAALFISCAEGKGSNYRERMLAALQKGAHRMVLCWRLDGASGEQVGILKYGNDDGDFKGNRLMVELGAYVFVKGQQARLKIASCKKKKREEKMPSVIAEHRARAFRNVRERIASSTYAHVWRNVLRTR